jgi:dienelactone hydrolase
VKNPKVTFTKLRKFDGYTVQNFAIETYPGLFLCGSVYAPSTKGKHALIICPNGHFNKGRYREDQQQRMGTLARMGAVCVDYDLYGWGESEKQVGAEAHHKSEAHTIQTMNGLILLDYMLAHRTDIDTNRIGVNGGSGGGSQTVLLAALDDRFTASAPVVSLASHFDGGCPCESGKSIHLAGGGSCNAEFAATFAPKPMLVVSDGGDWTASVPTLEFPYLQRVYGFYDAAGEVRNVHLPSEHHDFGPNKRNAVYDFFADVFKLDRSKLDESKVTIEEESAMYGMEWPK